MKSWSEAFTAYLAKLGLTQQEALFSLRKSRVSVTQSGVSYWCRGSRPREGTRRLVERWSKGAVAANLPASAETHQKEAS